MRATVTLLMIAALGAATAGCQQGGGSQASANAVAPAKTPYAAIADGKADVEGGIIQVAARTAGIVREVYVQEGDTVTRGQVLARQERTARRDWRAGDR